MKLTINKELVLPQIDVASAEEVLERLAAQLYEHGYVKKDYIKAIKDRERIYPTGLPSSRPAIAIPHADHDLVKETTIAVATLKKPIKFNNMENHSETVPVQIVFMLAISEPHGQIEMLQKIVEIIQDTSFRETLVKLADAESLLNNVQEKLFEE